MPTNSTCYVQNAQALKKTILWVIGGAAALYFLARFRFSQKANFILRSVRPGGTLLAPVVNIRMDVQNPTNQRIVIKSIVGNISVSGKFLASVSSFGDQVIAANSESTLNLTARPSALGVFNTLRQLITQPIPGTQIVFSGTANVDGVNVPVEQSQTL